MDEKIQPYESLVSHGDGLWTLDGDWYKTQFRRRMTVIRLTSGELMIHNPIRLHERDYAQLDTLGTVKWLFSPNAFHGEEAPSYKAQYPNSLWIVPSMKKSMRKTSAAASVRPDAVFQDQQAFGADEVECTRLPGLRYLEEVVLLHRPSKTLILTDLMFNLPQVGGIVGFLNGLNQINGRFGMSRLARKVFTQDRVALRKALDRLSTQHFTRVIVNHGSILTHEARAAFRRGYEAL